MPESPETRKFLTLSTVHLSTEDRVWLTVRAARASAYVGLYGFFVHCQEDPDWPKKCSPDPTRPENLTRIFQHVLTHQCDYVLFDADGEVCEELSGPAST